MDPYFLSVESEAAKNIEENERECFKDAIVSSRSLNKGFTESTKLKNAFPEILACIIAASFHIPVGLSMAYSAILIPHLESKKADVKATDVETSWVASVIVIAVPIGSLLGGLLMETVGRLRTLLIGTIPCVLGYILIASAQNIPMILLGRIFCGLATALATSPAVVYITEVARPELRGSLISMGPTLASFGMVLVYLKGAYLKWRLVAWLSIIYAIVPCFFLHFIPESPIWLVSKGRFDDAKKALEWMYKSEEKVAGKMSAAEHHFTTIMKENEIKLSEQRRSKRGGGVLYKFRGFLLPTGYKPIIILFLLFSFQQFSGIYVTLFYAVTWFEEVNSGINEYVASILVGLTRFFCSMVNTWLLRRYKRRVLCIVSCLGMAACMSLSAYYSLQIKNGDKSGNWVPVVSLLGYVMFSMAGLLTIPWTMTAELFPSNFRGIAQSISYAMANVLMFAAVQSYRSFTKFLGGAYAIQWFFAAVSVAASIFIWLLLPETHGKKLSDIEEYFQNEFIAVGAEEREKARKTKAKKERKQKVQTQVTMPLNPKTAENV